MHDAEFPLRQGRLTIVDGPHGGSPEDMAAALVDLAVRTRGRTRAVAVLGSTVTARWPRDALDAIGRQAVRLNIDRLVVVGASALPMYAAAQHEGSWGDEAAFVPDPDAAYDLLHGLLQPGDVVLVKSSDPAGLGSLGERLAGIA